MGRKKIISNKKNHHNRHTLGWSWNLGKSLLNKYYSTVFSYCFFVYFFEASLSWTFRFLRPFIASWMTQIWLTAAKLTCPCNTLWSSNSFARSDTGVVIDSEPYPSRDWQWASSESHVQNKPLLHSLSVFTLAVPRFGFTLRQNGL